MCWQFQKEIRIKSKKGLMQLGEEKLISTDKFSIFVYLQTLRPQSYEFEAVSRDS